MRNFIFFIAIITALFLSSQMTAQEIWIHHNSETGPKIDKYDARNVDSIAFAPCIPDSFKLIAVYPNSDCATTNTRPTINWEVQFPKRNIGEITYEVSVVEMTEQDTSLAVFDERKPHVIQKGLKSKNFEYPSNSPKLMMGRIYAWRAKAYENDIHIATSEIKLFYIIDYNLPFDINEVNCCNNNLIRNGKFELGNKVGVLGTNGNVDDWKNAYGNPFVIPDENGCTSPGYVQLEGNKTTGSSIKQALSPTNKIIQGKNYRFSLCVRLRDVPRNSKYVLIKAFAFNSSIPTIGTHPQPNADRALIGWSGKININEWGSVSLPTWKANKNFDNIAIFCYTNSSDTMAYCEIDNVCFVETSDSIPCDNYAYDDNGPIIDESLLESAQDTTYNFYDEYTGLVSDIYPQGNTSIDTWYPNNNPCASIGGTIPLEVRSINFNDSLIQMGFSGGIAQLDSILSENTPDSSRFKFLPPIDPLDNDCENSPFVYDDNLPFGGRDIIFVHGLKLSNLCDRRNNVPGATADWPDTKQEFYRSSSHYGYYKKGADDNWADHIQEWLTSKGYKNRYLTVAYNSSQSLEVAAHAVLTQIRDAMQDGTGVQATKSDKRGVNCFGINCIIISHSTGGLVTDVALSKAEKSKTDADIKSQLGDCGKIVDNVKAHLAFHPALAGSKMAKIFLQVQKYPILSTLLNWAVCKELSEPSLEMLSITHQSILVDLVPEVAIQKWGTYINTSPVPTITISGGHPKGVDNASILNWKLHPGLDDGVVTMSSQAGNPNYETDKFPSGYWRSGSIAQVYDMGISSGRANSFFMHQVGFTEDGFVGGASITHLSPTGMLQPVGSVQQVNSCENRYNNHYSFLQTASDHYIGPRGKSPDNNEGYQSWDHLNTSGFQPPLYNYDYGFGVNNEEVRAITSDDIYTKGLVSSEVATLPGIFTRGLYISFWIPIPNLSVKFFPLRIKFWWSKYQVNIPIWERKYYLLGGYNTNCECSYAYKYVLRP